MNKPMFGCILLTMGTRPEELKRGVESLKAQLDVDVDICIVGNGWDPATLFSDVSTLHLKENIGIPAGRNAGVKEVHGDLLFFLDDDAYLDDPYTLKKFSDIFNTKPNIGLIQPRVDAAEETKDLPTPKRWIPRLIKGDAKTPSPATTLWEGAIAIRRITFKLTGGWPDNFFYAHEGIELCWQVWNANQIPWYAGDIGIKHPVINPARHAFFYKLNARNRVWLARRNLPLGFAQLYVLSWTMISLLRFKKPEQRTPWLEGLKEGYSQDCGKNKRLTIRAIWNMTRAGRPPII